MNGDPSPGTSTGDGTDAPNNQTTDRIEATPLRTGIAIFNQPSITIVRLKCGSVDSYSVRVTKEIPLNTTRGVIASIGDVDELEEQLIAIVLDESGDHSSSSGSVDPTAKARRSRATARNVEVGGAFWRQYGRPRRGGGGPLRSSSPSAGWRTVAWALDASPGMTHDLAKSGLPHRTLRATPQLKPTPADSGGRGPNNSGGSDDNPQFSDSTTLQTLLYEGHHKGGVDE